VKRTSEDVTVVFSVVTAMTPILSPSSKEMVSSPSVVLVMAASFKENRYSNVLSGSGPTGWLLPLGSFGSFVQDARIDIVAQTNAKILNERFMM
jgi:hypothetical protein